MADPFFFGCIVQRSNLYKYKGVSGGCAHRVSSEFYPSRLAAHRTSFVISFFTSILYVQFTSPLFTPSTDLHSKGGQFLEAFKFRDRKSKRQVAFEKTSPTILEVRFKHYNCVIILQQNKQKITTGFGLLQRPKGVTPHRPLCTKMKSHQPQDIVERQLIV